jgi:epoxyqueuosine reductase
MDTPITTTSRLIKAKALELGFDRCGIAAATSLPDDRARLEKRLEKGFHGTSQYMAENLDVRSDPALLLPGVRSVIVTQLNYYTPYTPSKADVRISRYAYGDNYHDVLKKKLKLLSAYIGSLSPEAKNRACVDSAPIFEKRWAQKAGLGWIGKHCIHIHPNDGSFHFIGILLSTLELAYDEGSPDRCGDCMRCIEACPTGALLSPWNLDARRCIAYLTISHKGDLETDTPSDFAGNIYGCDICQEACPWNRQPAVTNETAFAPRKELLEKTAAEWNKMTEEEFKQLTKGSVVGEKNLGQILRNIKHIQGKR